MQVAKLNIFQALLTFFRLPPTLLLLTCDFTGLSIGFQNVSFITVTPKRPSFIVTVLTTKAWRVTFINITTGLGVICKLVSNRTGTLSSKGALYTFMSAASIIVRAALLIWNGIRERNKHLTKASYAKCNTLLLHYHPKTAGKTSCTIISYAT